jgi:hypothetical protein
VLGVEAVYAGGRIEDEAVGCYFEGDCWEARGEAPWRAGAGGGRVDCFGSHGEGHWCYEAIARGIECVGNDDVALSKNFG